MLLSVFASLVRYRLVLYVVLLLVSVSSLKTKNLKVLMAAYRNDVSRILKQLVLCIMILLIFAILSLVAFRVRDGRQSSRVNVAKDRG